MGLLNNTFIRLISIKHSQKKFFCEQENEVGRTENNFQTFTGYFIFMLFLHKCLGIPLHLHVFKVRIFQFYEYLQQREFLIVSFTACLTSLIFQQ